jgi:hypothetical protein
VRVDGFGLGVDVGSSTFEPHTNSSASLDPSPSVSVRSGEPPTSSSTSSGQAVEVAVESPVDVGARRRGPKNAEDPLRVPGGGVALRARDADEESANGAIGGRAAKGGSSCRAVHRTWRNLIAAGRSHGRAVPHAGDNGES